MTDYQPFLITFRLALITTAILFIVSIPLAYWLAHSKSKFKSVIETLVSMPLVLPPSVLGFYFLIAFGPSHGLGQFIAHYFNTRLVFSFGGLVVASVIYSLPFMVHPIQAGLAGLSPNLKEASFSLGKSKIDTLLKVLLPSIKPSLLTGLVLTFAHTVGEFGVVLMIGGNIPGQTRVASIAIYDEVEAMNYHSANIYAEILFAVTFIILLTVYFVNHRYAITKNL
jgi:molybdate transport system permease protein